MFSLIASRRFSAIGQRVELARGRERRVDQILGHAVTGEVEEAHLLARAANLPGHALESAGLAPERGPEVDDRDRPRRRLESFTAIALRMFIERLLLVGDVSIPRGRPAVHGFRPPPGLSPPRPRSWYITVPMKIAVSARNGSLDFECAAGEKILHAALRSGVELPYECATGTCGTCKATLVSGRHESHWPEAPGHRHLKSAAEILTCQSVAHEDCRLEVGVLKPGEAETVAPRALGGVIEAHRRLTHDVVAFDVRLDEPLDFEAGQFALLTVPGIAGARAYSMVNFDRRAERLSFVVKKKPEGR